MICSRARAAIDEIDAEMAALFERPDAGRGPGSPLQGPPPANRCLTPAREDAVIAKNTARLQDENPRGVLPQLFAAGKWQSPRAYQRQLLGRGRRGPTRG